MKKIIFEIGERVNGTRWTVIGGPISKNKATYYTCRCDCGCVREVSTKSLKYSKSKSCGCQHIENASKNVGNYTGRIDGSCISTIKSAKISKANTSGVRGVSFKKNIGKYEAYIGFKGKLKILGFFDTLEEAAQARKKAEDEIYKPFIEEHTKKPDGN